MSENKLTVGELVYKISGDMDNLKTELKKADTQIKKLQDSIEKNDKSVGKMAASFNTVKTAVIGFISGALVRGIFELSRSGAELDALSQSLNKLSGRIGLQGDEVLRQLQKTSAGTIANKDLILAANRAMTLGVATNMEEFNTLMLTARLRAQDMGLTTTQAFDNIVTGIGRGSPLILDNLGFIVSATQAAEDYAKQLGVTVEELTEAQKKEALKASIMAQGNKEIAEAGEIQLTYNDRIAQASTFVTNLKDNIGRALLPAMASLLDVTLKNNESLLSTTEDINKLGKVFYRVGQILIVVGKGIENGFRIIVGAVQHFTLQTAKSIQTVLSVASKATKALRLESEAVENGLQLTNDFIADLEKKMGENLDGIEASAETLTTALSEALDPQQYQGVGQDDVASLMQDLGTATETAGVQAEDAGDKIEEFQSKLLDFTRTAGKVREELEGKLGTAFKDFGDSIKTNFEESVSSLAQIVIGAEDKIKELKEQLKDTDDSDTRRDIKSQIKEQEEILKAREDFEERQAERITAIREKLEASGIDAAKAGIDSLLTVRTLEEQIEEERRLASLDEFTRFEEEQSRKLILLTDAFITEATLLQEKIATQKQYEADLTSYLQSEDSKRLEGTEAWATATIAKYKEVADSLRNLISTQAQIQNMQVGSISPVSPSSVVQTPEGNKSKGSTTNNNSTNISAPVTINGQNIQNLSAQEMSAILGFELNKYIR